MSRGILCTLETPDDDITETQKLLQQGELDYTHDQSTHDLQSSKVRQLVQVRWAEGQKELIQNL